MLPLVAGQLLREAVVGLNDILRARATGAVAAAVAAVPLAAGNSSNPLRSSTSIEQALQRLFERMDDFLRARSTRCGTCCGTRVTTRRHSPPA